MQRRLNMGETKPAMRHNLYTIGQEHSHGAIKVKSLHTAKNSYNPRYEDVQYLRIATEGEIKGFVQRQLAAMLEVGSLMNYEEMPMFTMLRGGDATDSLIIVQNDTVFQATEEQSDSLSALIPQVITFRETRLRIE